ncbi:MAG: pinensin family lanthipeptide [Cyclobacteriaceae bacterium]
MKKKLNLNEIKVKSFVTNLDQQTEKTVKGGSHVTGCGLCDTQDDFFCKTVVDKCIVTNDRNCPTNDFRCTWICPVPYEPADK